MSANFFGFASTTGRGNIRKILNSGEFVSFAPPGSPIYNIFTREKVWPPPDVKPIAAVPKKPRWRWPWHRSKKRAKPRQDAAATATPVSQRWVYPAGGSWNAQP